MAQEIETFSKIGTKESVVWSPNENTSSVRNSVATETPPGALDKAFLDVFYTIYIAQLQVKY